jgi:hypothetical protein
VIPERKSQPCRTFGSFGLMHIVAARWQVKNPGHAAAQLAEPTAVIKKRIKAII